MKIEEKKGICMKCAYCGGAVMKAGRDVLKFLHEPERLMLDRWVCIKCGQYTYTDVPKDGCDLPTGM